MRVGSSGCMGIMGACGWKVGGPDLSAAEAFPKGRQDSLSLGRRVCRRALRPACQAARHTPSAWRDARLWRPPGARRQRRQRSSLSGQETTNAPHQRASETK